MTTKKKPAPAAAGEYFDADDSGQLAALPSPLLDEHEHDEATGEAIVAGAPGLLKRTRAIEWLILHHQGGHPVETREQLFRLSRGEGFADIPYGAYVLADGTLIEGRPEAYIGAAQLGINAIADSICLAGNFDEHDNPDGRRGWPLEPTDAQIATAGAWLARKLKKHPRARWAQHKDVAKITGNPRVATGCPGSRAIANRTARAIFLVVGGRTVAEARRLALAGK